MTSDTDMICIVRHDSGSADYYAVGEGEVCVFHTQGGQEFTGNIVPAGDAQKEIDDIRENVPGMSDARVTIDE